MMSQPLDEQPVGPEFGLEPQRPELYISQKPPVTSENLFSDDQRAYLAGTEYGGVAGRVQPPPHVPTARERRMQIMFIDPTDPGTEVGSVQAPELEGDFQ
jgi:hypothetical protein